MMRFALGKALQGGVAVLVLGSLAAAAAPLTWHLRGQTTTLPAAAPVAVAAVTPPAPPDIGPILTFAPFGSSEVAAPQTAAAAPLDLTLLGIVLRDDPSESMALIAADGTPANFRTGNKIGDNAILDRVNADHVVLLVGAERVILGFPNADPVTLDDGVISPSTSGSPADLLAAISAAPATEEYTEPDAALPPPVTTQDYIDLWRARITANPKQVLDEIGLVAGDNGYTIAENHDSGVTRAGLQAGDLVKTVNGQPVGNVDSDRALYDEVANSGMARIEVERDGRTMTLSFPLQ